MASPYASQLDLMVRLIHDSGELAAQLFYDGALRVTIKPDGSKVTNIDEAVSRLVIKAAQRHGLKVRSEETGSTGHYGDNRVFDLDPIDSTSDLVAGYARQPRRSNAAPSLGFWDNGPVAGAVVFPLLGVAPMIYSAALSSGAYREQAGRRMRLAVDTGPERGIVFVSSKTTAAAAQHISRELVRLGYVPAPQHGAVFKACAVADPELLRQYPLHAAFGSRMPLVGFVSHKAYLHDVAAATPIVREAGGVATTPQNHGDKQPWVAANNQTVYDDLMGLVTIL